jgi:hypothetical protein
VNVTMTRIVGTIGIAIWKLTGQVLEITMTKHSLMDAQFYNR